MNSPQPANRFLHSLFISASYRHPAAQARRIHLVRGSPFPQTHDPLFEQVCPSRTPRPSRRSSVPGGLQSAPDWAIIILWRCSADLASSAIHDSVKKPAHWRAIGRGETKKECGDRDVPEMKVRFRAFRSMVPTRFTSLTEPIHTELGRGEHGWRQDTTL